MLLPKATGFIFVIVGLLVFCVIMQMVGVNHSLWNPFEIETDFLELSIGSAATLVVAWCYVYFCYTTILGYPPDPLLYQRMLARSLFRPPAS